jgi:hypothetical protein
MLKDAALGFWHAAFPEIRRYWEAEASHLTQRIGDERPMLAESGTVCIRALPDGSYACWASTIGEHPIGSRTFAALHLGGTWQDGKASLEPADGNPGDGNEETAHNFILERCEHLLTEDYEAFMLHNGDVLEDEEPPRD